MIFNMVGGGAGGAGATLVVSSPTDTSVTVSKDDKSYTKNSGSLGSVTFKGLATGVWTVEANRNGQTVTRTIEITADYTITIAFFSASINITYPAMSTCVVTNENQQVVASDTNTSSSTKTWTATVSASGRYVVTANATDGSGKSKSQDVYIQSSGQSVNVTIAYQLVLFDSSVTSGWASRLFNPTYASAGIVNGKLTVRNSATTYSGALLYKETAVSTSGYTNAKITVDSVKTANGTDSKQASLILQTSPALGSIAAVAQAAARVALTGPGTFTLRLPEGTYYVGIEVGQNEVTASKIWFE